MDSTVIVDGQRGLLPHHTEQLQHGSPIGATTLFGLVVGDRDALTESRTDKSIGLDSV